MSLSAVGLASRVDREQELWAAAQSRSSVWQVLLLPPNLVVHARLALALAAAALAPRPAALLLFAASIALDALDGALARRLGQETALGAFYDVAADNLTRALLWAGAAAGLPAPAGLWAGLPVALEGVTLACTHAAGGAAWKTGPFRDAPRWVCAVMAGGLRSPAGALAVAGLFGLPLWLFARACLPPDHLAAAASWGLVLVPGRALAAAVELWVVACRLRQLAEWDAAARLRRQA